MRVMTRNVIHVFEIEILDLIMILIFLWGLEIEIVLRLDIGRYLDLFVDCVRKITFLDKLALT